MSGEQIERQYVSYNTHLDAIVKNAGAMGFTVLETCDVLGCNKNTFYRWLETHTSFREAWTQGTSVATKRVEETLYDQIINGTVTKKVKKQKRGGETIITQETITHPPALNAIRFWLCNRSPERWALQTYSEPKELLEEVDKQVTITLINPEGTTVIEQ